MNSSLRELSDIEYGASPKEIRADDKTSIGIYGTGGFLGHATKSLFNGPLVVVARKGTLDNPLYVRGDCWVIDTAFVVLPKADVEAKWLYYQLLNYDLKKLNESTGVPSINREYLYRLSFENPGSAQQRKIARILSAIDEVIWQTEETIEKLKKIKQGVMHDLFTRGIDVKTGLLRPSYFDAPELYQETELGWIPKEWEACPIETIASKDKNAIVDGPFGSNLKSIHYRNEGIPIIQSGFVTKNIFQADYYLYVTEDKFRSEIRSKVSAGDIVMAKIGAHCGACAILPDNHSTGILAGNCLKITVNKENLNKYIESLLHYLNDTGMISRIVSTTAQPAVSMSKLKRMIIQKPNRDEQGLIVERISLLIDKIDVETRKLCKHSLIKQGLMQDLLTGKVEVSPDPQDKEYQGAN